MLQLFVKLEESVSWTVASRYLVNITRATLYICIAHCVYCIRYSYWCLCLLWWALAICLFCLFNCDISIEDETFAVKNIIKSNLRILFKEFYAVTTETEKQFSLYTVLGKWMITMPVTSRSQSFAIITVPTSTDVAMTQRILFAAASMIRCLTG